MPVYEVTLEREVIEETFVEVEAKDEKEAVKKAKEEIKYLGRSDWGRIWVSKPAYTDICEEEGY